MAAEGQLRQRGLVAAAAQAIAVRFGVIEVEDPHIALIVQRKEHLGRDGLAALELD